MFFYGFRIHCPPPITAIAHVAGEPLFIFLLFASLSPLSCPLSHSLVVEHPHPARRSVAVPYGVVLFSRLRFAQPAALFSSSLPLSLSAAPGPLPPNLRYWPVGDSGASRILLWKSMPSDTRGCCMCASWLPTCGADSWSPLATWTISPERFPDAQSARACICVHGASKDPPTLNVVLHPPFYGSDGIGNVTAGSGPPV